ncbi:hypothetical protein L484_006046 [Morus notabilis]|uniref:Uncharacterized protein n=1 Tax=Morus notabilis TaxID=981085 RepID=W9QQN2_9ROSA|nr:hypothetical protein L484_006046 [Morus notabilis]
MAGDRNGLMPEKAEGYSERRDEEEEKENERKSRKSRENSGSDSEEDRRKQGKSRRKTRESSDSDGERRKGKSRRRYSSKEDSSSGSESEYSDSESESSESEESESEGGRRKRKEKKRRREKEEERERKKRKREKERKRRRREREEERKKKEKRMKKKEKRRKKDRGKTGAVTNSWGKYGIIKETDMWNKRPEFTAWLAEVKQVNLESLPNWEEKQMFKEFMEDHNTATFPSKKYYNLDAYFKHKMEKDMKRGYKKIQVSERTVFNDEEQRRKCALHHGFSLLENPYIPYQYMDNYLAEHKFSQELLREREKQKEAEVDALKRSMQSGMAQAMKEQAQLREEMVYQYKVGNLEAAAAIQRRLDPDARFWCHRLAGHRILGPRDGDLTFTLKVLEEGSALWLEKEIFIEKVKAIGIAYACVGLICGLEVLHHRGFFFLREVTLRMRTTVDGCFASGMESRLCSSARGMRVLGWICFLRDSSTMERENLGGRHILFGSRQSRSADLTCQRRVALSVLVSILCSIIFPNSSAHGGRLHSGGFCVGVLSPFSGSCLVKI